MNLVLQHRLQVKKTKHYRLKSGVHGLGSENLVIVCLSACSFKGSVFNLCSITVFEFA